MNVLIAIPFPGPQGCRWRWLAAWAALLCVESCLVAAATTQPATMDVPAATFPRIAMLWSPAEGGKGYEIPRILDNVARHHLIVLLPENMGLEWVKTQYAGQAEAFEPASVAAARKTLAGIRKLNPVAVVLLELYFFEQPETHYPDDCLWWLRDRKGQKRRFWPGTYQMDTSDPAYASHIVRKVMAVRDAFDGQVGIFFDNVRFDAASKQAWVALLGQMRLLCGEIPVLVNAGFDRQDPTWLCPLVNGFLYEDSVAYTADGDTEAFYADIAAH